MKTITLTPDWILQKLPHTRYADGGGSVSVYTNDATNANFIELALDSLHIHYEAYDYLNDNADFVFGFDLRIEEIKNECPIFYQSVKEIDKNNLINRKSWKN